MSDQPYDAEAIAKRFEDLAARIRLNKDAKFGGAFLLVPPPLTGNVIETLVLSDQNPGLFWSVVFGMVEGEFKRLKDQQLRQSTFGA